FLRPRNRKLLAFLRQTPDQTILVIANLSRFTQPVELNLARFAAWIPVELFGQTRFPKIDEELYLFTLTPHACLWFVLEPPAPDRAPDLKELPHIRVGSEWTEFLDKNWQPLVERRLPAFLRQQ